MAPRLRTRAIVLVFALFIAVPILSGLAGIGTRSAEAEVSEEDAPKTSGLRWLDYFDDHFPLRTALIHAHALASMAMRVSPSPTVIRGRDGWLYYADDSGLDDYISAAPMSREELDDWRDTIVHTRDTLRALGIAYVFAVAPDKHVIYPEHMPSSIHRLRQEYRLQELTDYLRKTTDVTVVDLRQPLLQAKQREQVYFRTDSHWDEAGAYVAYRELLLAAARHVPSLEPSPRSAVQNTTADLPGGDIAEMLGLRTDINEVAPVVRPAKGWRAHVDAPADMSDAGFEVGRVVTSIADPTLPRLLMIRDSFGSRLIPFLSEHFSRAVYLWRPDVDMDDVKQERPTVVIQEVVGRRLQTYQP
jgi:alginate O-acetyltransferase complex protein AlgJ